MRILSLLASNGYISYNKLIVSKLGVYEAILLGELCSIAGLFKSCEFYFSQEKISSDTSLSTRQIRSATEMLMEYGIISVEKKGIPCRLWYRLDESAIVRILNDDSEKEPEQNERKIPRHPKKCPHCDTLLFDNSGVCSSWYCLKCSREWRLNGRQWTET
mgnify:CR=1 FL=1